MAVRFGPLAFFLKELDDSEYAPLLKRALDTLLDLVEIVPRDERDAADPGGVFEKWLPFVRSHMLVCQDVHNSMLDVRPTGRLFSVHKRLISIVKAYSLAVADYADHCAAWASEDIDMDSARRHERDGRTWDRVASDFTKKLEKKWGELPARDRERLTAMLGSDEFPEQLEKLADPLGDGIVWGLP